jgi:hypothetical protein
MVIIKFFAKNRYFYKEEAANYAAFLVLAISF